MARETYGLLEAARRARDWMPHLKHDGQAIVLAAIVFYTDAAGVSDPSGWQAGMGRRSDISARRIFGELEELGVIQEVGTRPTFNESGRPKGGKVKMWSICPTDHLDDQVGNASQPITKRLPTDHETAPNRSPGRSPLNTEYLSSSDQLPITDAEVEEIALEKARANGARSPDRYAAKIISEDRRELESEARRRKAAALVAGAAAECGRCDASGRIWLTNDGDLVAHDDPDATTADICDHRSDLAEIDELSESYS